MNKNHDLGAGWYASLDEEHPGSLTIRNPEKGQRINLSADERRRLQTILETANQAQLEEAARNFES